MDSLPKLRPQFRANIYAQGMAFILNVGLYAMSNNYFFLWTELACLSFIGTYSAKSKSFFDRNIFNHFVSVTIYYLISLAISDNTALYLCLIFIFTYSFFILRNNGYHKSLNLWMYIQALLIGTTFTSYPFEYKILATIVAYIEAQLILNLAFKFLSSTVKHEAEQRYAHVIKIPVRHWIDAKRPEVRLALRGAFTAATLYAICSSFHDMKPNWAVVAAVSCLQRDDYESSLRAIKGVGIGSLLGWPLSALIIYIFNGHSDISTIMLWGLMLGALICSFELALKPRLWLQILNAMLFLMAVTCVAISLKINEYGYLDLKVINSLIGVGVAFLSLLLWKKLHQVFDEVEIK